FRYFRAGLALCAILILELLTVFGIFPKASPLTFFLATLSVAFMVVGRKPTMDAFHPVRIFGALWCLCLSLASMRLLPSVISEWNSFMWGCVLTALIAFVAGFGIAQFFWKTDHGNAPPASAQLLPPEGLLPNRKALLTAAVCLAVGLSVLI